MFENWNRYSKSFFFGYITQKNWTKASLNMAFLFFFAKYLTRFDNFSKLCSTIELFCYGKSSNTIAKKKRKSPAHLPFNQFFRYVKTKDLGYSISLLWHKYEFFFNIQTLLKRHNELYVYISAIFCDFSNDTI